MGLGSYYRSCSLCPRSCGIDRSTGENGFCGESAVCRLAYWGSHFGEEPCFTGANGSGTVFFAGCSCRCFFCQNYQISLQPGGRDYTPEELLDAVYQLSVSGVHNLNFVTPDHFWPHIEWLCQKLREKGVVVPFIFNCSGYQREDMVARYSRHISIFLPDFKYADRDLAQFCIGDRNYPDIALRAIGRMVEEVGFLDHWEPGSIASRGVLVRHLVLPGQLDNSIQALRLLRQEFGRYLPLSVMNQFLPTPLCRERGVFDRRITSDEWQTISELVAELGFENVYIQELQDSDEFSPDFRQDQPFGLKKDAAKV